MSKIKGLTVEIGGDTTKLGKALEDVNKKSRDLSSELGQVNRLLKFDPGNADLVAQKQKILAEAVSNTKSKLDTLKEAERQVQAQFAKGEVSVEQVRELQREIIDTEQKLKSYEKAAQECAKGNKDVGDAAKDAEKNSSGLGATLANVAKTGFLAIVAAAAACVTGLIAAAESTRDYRMEMGKLDTAFTTNGFSSEAATDAYKDLVGVLGEYDQSVEAANHLAKLTDTEKELAVWTGDILPGVYATFGDSLPIEGLTEAANETAKLGKVTGPLADALNWAGVNEDEFNASLAACTTEQERQALITETLAGLYGEASEKYKELNAEVIRANQANDAWMASLAGIGGAIEPVITDIKLMGASLLDELVPGVQNVAEAFRGLMSGDVLAGDALGAALSDLVSSLLTKIVELAPTIMQVAVSLVTSLTTSLISMIPQLVVAGITMMTSLLQGVTEAIPQITQAIVDMIPQLVLALVTGIPALIQGGVQLLLALVQAIPQIIPPLVSAIPQIVMALVNGLLTQIPVLLQGAIQLLLALVQAVPVIIQQLVPMIPQIVTAVVSALIQAIPVLLQGAVQLFFALVQAIPIIIGELVPLIPEIIAAIVSGLLDGLVAIGSAALEMGRELVDKFINKAKEIPGKLWNAIIDAVERVTTWGAQVVERGRTAANNLVTGVVSFVKNLPSNIWSAIVGAVDSVTNWGSQLVSRGKTAATNLVNAVVNGVSSLPSRMLSIGRNLVEGLGNGILNSLGWLLDRVSSMADAVLGKLSGLFGIHSPATTTAYMGEMLDEGLAVGLEKYAGAPISAMQRVAGGVLDAADTVNGATLERDLQANFGTGAGLMDKLDRILTAIERGQIITIDGDQLVGATADRYDRRLGARRMLAARGAI